MEKEKVKQYQTEDLIIYWDAQKCIHASMCWTGLPKVFQPRERPWIKMNNATPEQIINVINQCPSGALKYKLTEGSSVSSSLAKGLAAVQE